MIMKVLFIWKAEEALEQHLRSELQSTGLELIFPQEASESYYLEVADEIDVIVGWNPTRALLEKCQQVKLLINPGAGVQHLKKHLPYLQERGIVLVNGHGNAYFTAQHMMALLLASTNKLIPHHQGMLAGKWRLGDALGKSTPLRDRHVGLLGYGHINKWVHKFLDAFGPKVSILRKNKGKTELAVLRPIERLYDLTELSEFLGAIDVLLIAIPLTELTRDLIDEKAFALLGKEALVINVGRGPIINEEALYKALLEHTIAWAAIDVWYNYSPEEDEEGKKRPHKFPLHQLDNIVLSPHRAGSPLDHPCRWEDVIENLKRFAAKDKPYLNVVNLEEAY